MIWAILTAVRGFLAKLPWQIWAILGALAVVFLAYSHGKGVGRDEVRAEIEAANKANIERQDKANAKADTERAIDHERNESNERERNDAIANDGRTGLSCQRLRAAGYREAALPAECRR